MIISDKGYLWAFALACGRRILLAWCAREKPQPPSTGTTLGAAEQRSDTAEEQEKGEAPREETPVNDVPLDLIRMHVNF